MGKRDITYSLNELPGRAATGMLILLTTLWVYWGAGEMYYEGWWGAWTNRLPYLVTGTVFLIFTGLSMTWPRLGGWMMIAAGVGAFTWWMTRLAFDLRRLFMGFLLGGFAALIGILFLFEARYQQRRRSAGWKPPANWFRRNLRCLVAFAPPLGIFVAATVFFAPMILTRYDDGDRGARRIEGNGVTLIWAPTGPGWSEGIGPSQAAGRLLPNANLSWDGIATYGVPPVGYGDKPGYDDKHATASDMLLTGLCRFLNADGTMLMPEPQDFWRLPTTDEIVRSLVRHGQNAGCVWDGVSDQAACVVQPNKDAPLWDPDASPIYYWSADEYDQETAWYVPYTGGGRYGGAIDYQLKDWGNPRHGFRCAREP
jgi:hypothetical protein